MRFNRARHIDISPGGVLCFVICLIENYSKAATLEKLPDYFRDTMEWVFGKGRRSKDKDTTIPTKTECKPYLHEDCIREKIINEDLEKYLDLPQGLDYSEWMATHTISLFEHVNLMHGTVLEYCTSTECPVMTGPNNMQYLWLDEKGKKVKYAAPVYVDYVMTFTQTAIHDEEVFPTKYGNDFPSSFETTVKKIHRLLFHVIAHIYQAHFKQIVANQLHPHLNTLFLHFTTFTRKFNLIDDKETESLHDLCEMLKGVEARKEQELDGSCLGSGDSTTHATKDEENKENFNQGQNHIANQIHNQTPTADASKMTL